LDSPDQVNVYIEDPAKSSKIATVGNGDYMYLVILKVCQKLSISAGMALTPSKFYDFAADSPAKLLYFTPNKVIFLFF